MEALQPQEATALFNNLSLPALKNEHRITKQIIKAIPLDKGSYRPDPVSKTAMELAWHIAAAENWFLESVSAGEFKAPGAGRPDSIRHSADVARWYAEAFEKNF